MDKPLNIILIGRSGSGKGTQAELLNKKFPYFYSVATGDLFRDLAKKESDTAKRVGKILEEGGLPYDDIATTLWMHDLAYNLKEDQGLLGDGFPRRLNEAKDLDGFLNFLERLDRTFYFLLNISEEECKRRLLARGRYDDTESGIAGRMNFFKERVSEVIDYYESMNKLITINGEKSPEKVNEEIMQHLS